MSSFAFEIVDGRISRVLSSNYTPRKIDIWDRRLPFNHNIKLRQPFLISIEMCKERLIVFDDCGHTFPSGKISYCLEDLSQLGRQCPKYKQDEISQPAPRFGLCAACINKNAQDASVAADKDAERHGVLDVEEATIKDGAEEMKGEFKEMNEFEQWLKQEQQRRRDSAADPGRKIKGEK